MRLQTTFTAVAVSLLVVASVVYVQFLTDMAHARHKARSGSSVISTEYGDIEYADEGDGPSALLIHGAGGGYDQGLLLGRIALDSTFRRIAVSRFGYLRSPVPAEATVTTQAAMYAALLDRLGVNRVIVVAGSAGGPSALQFAHDFPERTSALVLVSAVSKVMTPGEQQDARQIAIVQAIQRSDFLSWLMTKAFRSLFLGLLGLPPDIYRRLGPEEQALAHEMLDVMHPMSLRRAGSLREGEYAPLNAAELGQISAPTLILRARDDSLVVVEHAEHARRSIKQSRLVLFKTGGHGLLAQVDGVRSNVRAFLDSARNR